MTDPRHVDDTLFFIMEEDWRLTRKDGFSHAELLEQQRERGERIVSLSPDSSPPGSSPAEAAHIAALKDDWKRITQDVRHAPLPGKKGKGKGDKAQTRQVQRWPLRTTKPAGEEFEHTSIFLQQLIRLVTAAHRSAHGSLVWMSWNGTDKNPKIQCHSTIPHCLLSALRAPSA